MRGFLAGANIDILRYLVISCKAREFYRKVLAKKPFLKVVMGVFQEQSRPD